MAKKEKQQPIADDSVGKLKVKQKKEVQPTKNETEGNVTKVKAKMTKPVEISSEPTVTKVNLDKKPEEVSEVKEEVTKDNTNDGGVVAEPENAEPVQKQEEVQPQAEAQETPVVEEITVEDKKQEVEKVEEAVVDAIEKAEATGQELPENIQKLLNFMEDTGGDINDYVKINQDYSDMDNQTLLYEYYKQTKPHLSSEEIDFIMEDQFAYDEEDNTEKEIKRKTTADC